MSKLIEHAKRELELAGLFAKDSDYGGELAKAVMPLVAVFSAQGHSGFSAHTVIDLFTKLARFETLSPLTDEPNEWRENDLRMSGDPVTHQNVRDSSCFSHDGGKTYYDIASFGHRIYHTKKADTSRLECHLVQAKAQLKDVENQAQAQEEVRAAEASKLFSPSLHGQYAGPAPSQHEDVEAPLPPSPVRTVCIKGYHASGDAPSGKEHIFSKYHELRDGTFSMKSYRADEIVVSFK